MTENHNDVTSEENTAQENENLENESQETVQQDGDSAENSSDEKDAEIAKLRAIAKKRTEQLDKLKQALNNEEEVKEEEKPQPTGLSRDEAILFAKGLSEEEVEKASKIAEFEGINLTEAVDSDIFTIWKEKKDKEAKSEKAQLGASNGSPKVEKQKDFTSKELTPEEHKELWKQKISK